MIDYDEDETDFKVSNLKMGDLAGGRKMADIQENKQITIYDIAREAGVSPATVSRVLTNSANVRSEKREKIQAIIDKYNFKPNALAKSLSDTRSNLMGFITADVRNPFYSAVYIACENAAKEKGYRVLLCNSLGEGEREIEQLHMLVQQRVDAIIQLGGRVDDVVTDKTFAKETKQIVSKIPMVVNGRIDGVDAYSVRIDAKEGCGLLVEHLIQLGHKKIALVGGRQNVISTLEKYNTYKEILEKHGIEFREEYVINGHYDQETGYNGVKKLMGLKDMPTAIIAINDFAAAGVIKGIHELGLKVPKNISVVSYDNTYITELTSPRLTSIDYNYDLFGKTLVETAISAIEGVEVPKTQMVTPHLVVRESSSINR